MPVAGPTSRVLSSSQLQTLAQHGEERTAAVGETLFEVGDETYPFIAIVEGEVAVIDAAGQEIVRHGASGFLGEMNLLSGQTVFLTAVVTEPMRYIAVDREALRQLLFEDGALSDLLLSAFIERRELLQQRAGDRDRDHRAARLRGDPPAARVRPPAATPLLLGRPGGERGGGGAGRRRSAPDEIPLVRLPGGAELRRPSNGELSRALGIGLELGEREEVDLLVIGGGPAGLGAAVYGASEGLDTLVIESTVLGGQAGTSRRIENYLGFPAGNQRHRTDQPRDRPRPASSAPARRPPTAPRRSSRAPSGHLVRLEDGTRDLRRRRCCSSTGAEYRRLPVADLDQYEGISVFYAAGPPEAQLCGAQRVGVVGGGNSAAQAAVWLARGGALVTLLHRRADLSETMSHYLIEELERYGVADPRPQRSRRPARRGRQARGRHAHRRRAAARSPSSSSSSAPRPAPSGSATSSPATPRASSSPAREAGADGLLETSVPGVYAAGDVRAGSIKRCATAVGEGATVVRFVHEHLTPAGASL